MSLSQQRGTVSASQGTVQLPQLAPYEYLWLYATAAGAGASAWWSQAPGGRTPNVQLGAGQWRLVDLGAVSAWQLWLAGDLEWITDTDPISEQVSTAGPMTIQTAAGAPVETVFPSAQQVTFGAPQQVTFAGPQEVTFPTAQQVTFAAPQQVTVNAGSVTITGGQQGASVSIDTPPVSLGQISIAAGTTSGSLTPTIPANCTALAVLPVGSPGTLNWQLINQVQWGAGSIQKTWKVTDLSPTIFPVVGSDQGYVVTVSVPSAMSATMDVAQVVALIGYGGEQVYAPPNQPLNVQLTPGGGGPPVTMLFSPTSIANGSQILAAPPAGCAYYITKIQCDAAAADAAHSAGVCAWVVGVQPSFVSTDYNPPVKTTSALQYDAYTVAQNATIAVYGYIGPA